jgi:hypothetical protein
MQILRKLTPDIAVLAKASSNLTDRPDQGLRCSSLNASGALREEPRINMLARASSIYQSVNHLSVTAVISEKLAEAGDSLGTRIEWECPPLKTATEQRPLTASTVTLWRM